jgi:hypothetical protein
MASQRVARMRNIMQARLFKLLVYAGTLLRTVLGTYNCNNIVTKYKWGLRKKFKIDVTIYIYQYFMNLGR